MTDSLLARISAAQTIKEVEEIYKPYKLKKKTKAMIAIEKGFQVIADMIKQGSEVEEFGSEYAELQKEYSSEEILEGAKCIIAAEVSAQSDLRVNLKQGIYSGAKIISKQKTAKSLAKLNEKDTAQISKFDIYADFSAPLSTIKPYQILALNR